MNIKSSAWLFAMAATCGASLNAAAATNDAVEYYHAGFGHYFITAFPEEAAAIDAGNVSGWARTGYTFKVETAAAGGYSPVCRFFSTSFAPKSSHFYTPFAAECNTVKQNANWQFEAIAFFVQESATDGSCPVGKTKVYRLYNNGLSGAPNHRYTTSTAVRSAMIAQGWIPEGLGAEGVVFCAEGAGATPTDPMLADQNTRQMVGGTWTFSYVYNGTQSNDVLSFTTVVSDPSSVNSPYYAQGTNQYGLTATARYNLQTGLIEVRSPFAIPATDYFTVNFTSSNNLSGCYYFLPTLSSTPTGSCTSVTGIRR